MPHCCTCLSAHALPALQTKLELGQALDSVEVSLRSNSAQTLDCRKRGGCSRGARARRGIDVVSVHNCMVS